MKRSVMKCSILISILGMLLATHPAVAEGHPEEYDKTVTILPAGGCRGLFRYVRDQVYLRRNPNVSLQDGGKCTLLLRNKSGKALRSVRLIAKRSRYSGTSFPKSSRVRSTSTGSAIDFNYEPGICFYYVDFFVGRRHIRMRIVNADNRILNASCFGAV